MGDMANYYGRPEYYDQDPPELNVVPRTSVRKCMTIKKTEPPRKFWIVCRDPSTVQFHEPKNAITTKVSAMSRAEALARETGHRFYVLETIIFCEPTTPPIKWGDL